MQLIDETEADLRKLIERDFGRLGGPPTDRDVLDWMHYRARLIPRRLRAVTVSPEVVAQMATYPAIGQLRSELERGEDVSPWLSDGVRNRKQDALADLMFNDWQISHFHLGRFFVSPNKVHRQKLLLFALVKANRAVFLDVHPHGRRTWTTTQILRVLLQTSPQDMLEWKGAFGTQSGGYTDTELLRLREGGLGYTIQIDGRIFSPPGGGVSTSRHADRLVRQFNHLSTKIRDLHRRFKENDLPHQLLRQLMIIGIPARLGVRLRDDGCLVLHEKARAIDLLAMPPFE